MNILVRNLHRTVTERQLLEMFLKFGTIKSFNIVIDQITGVSKGFGFVDMPERSEAEAAIKALDGKFTRGQKLRVKNSTKSSQTLKEYKPEGDWKEQSQPRERHEERSSTGRRTERTYERPAGRPTERSTERSNGRPTRRSTEKPDERPSGRPTKRSYERSDGRTTERSTERPTERPTGRPTGRFSERPTERSTERRAGKSTSGSTQRPTGRPTERSGARSTERPAGRSDKRPTGRSRR